MCIHKQKIEELEQENAKLKHEKSILENKYITLQTEIEKLQKKLNGIIQELETNKKNDPLSLQPKSERFRPTDQDENKSRTRMETKIGPG